MTTNNTLSIATALRLDAIAYKQKIGVLKLPNKPSGEKMRYLITVQQVILFANSQNQKIAKDFLTYLIQRKSLVIISKLPEVVIPPYLNPIGKILFGQIPKILTFQRRQKLLMKGFIKTMPKYQ